MGDRCTGHCCERFYLPFSPEALKDRAERFPEDKQLQQVAGMVVYLEYGINPDSRTPPSPTRQGHWYTCSNFNKETRGCNIYQTRPDMCRDYPYSEPCDYKTCTWEDGLAGTYPYQDYADKMLEAAARCLTTPEDKRFDIFYHQSKKLKSISDDEMEVCLKEVAAKLKEIKCN